MAASWRRRRAAALPERFKLAAPLPINSLEGPSWLGLVFAKGRQRELFEPERSERPSRERRGAAARPAAVALPYAQRPSRAAQRRHQPGGGALAGPRSARRLHRPLAREPDRPGRQAHVSACVYAALFHDIGVVAAGAQLAGLTTGDERLVFASILPLAPEEAALGVANAAPNAVVDRIVDHVIHGARAAQELSLPQEAIKGISAHHERWDGGGYPHGLSHDEIPMVGRVVTLADEVESLIVQEPSPAPRPAQPASLARPLLRQPPPTPLSSTRCATWAAAITSGSASTAPTCEPICSRSAAASRRRRRRASSSSPRRSPSSSTLALASRTAYRRGSPASRRIWDARRACPRSASSSSTPPCSYTTLASSASRSGSSPSPASSPSRSSTSCASIRSTRAISSGASAASKRSRTGRGAP